MDTLFVIMLIVYGISRTFLEEFESAFRAMIQEEDLE